MKAYPGQENPYEIGRKLQEADLDIRLDRLRRRIKDRGGIIAHPANGPELASEIEAAFLENVLLFENALETTHANMLREDGIDLPPANSFPDDEDGDAALHRKLREVIDGLAARRVFLECTDHLEDRELYYQLVTRHLQEPTEDLADCPEYNCHLDILGGCSDEDIALYLRYYADDQYRKDWVDQFPNDPLPPRENPPCVRGAHLPRAMD
jgi:hypothetical protein